MYPTKQLKLLCECDLLRSCDKPWAKRTISEGEDAAKMVLKELHVTDALITEAWSQKLIDKSHKDHYMIMEIGSNWRATVSLPCTDLTFPMASLPGRRPESIS